MPAAPDHVAQGLGVVAAAHEAHGHPVDAKAEAELQVLAVLLRECGDVQAGRRGG